jgi:hypothetical protein
VKDHGLEWGFNPMLDRIQYLAKNGLTSLMVLHDFLSKCLTPLQDQPRPAWMYTGVNDIMWLDHGPESSLDEDLMAASLKVLTADQFSTELVVLPAAYEPICVNQVVRTTLLTAMPTLDDVDIAPVQRGNLSRSMVIPEAGGLGDATGGRGQGSGPAGGGQASGLGGGPAGGRGGALVGSRGGGPAGGFGPRQGQGKTCAGSHR